MGTIYLIRHGFTPANNANYNGQRGLSIIAKDKDMPLEKKYGEKQALEIGEFLSNIKGKTLIMVSPYYRAKQTLNLALEKMNGDYEISTSYDLRENNTGIHYAKGMDEVIEEYPEALKVYEKLKTDPYTTRYIGGECGYDVRDRTKDISLKIKEASKYYDNVFVFAHGAVNRWIFYHLNGYLLPRSQKNGEVVIASGDKCGQFVFTPKAFVPKGYMIDINDYLDCKKCQL